MKLLGIKPDIALEGEPVRSEAELLVKRIDPVVPPGRLPGGVPADHEHDHDRHLAKPSSNHSYQPGSVVTVADADPAIAQRSPTKSAKVTRGDDSASLLARSVARGFDLVWQSVVIIMIMRALVDVSSWGIYQYLVFLGIFGSFFVLMIDTLVLGLIGTTPGKCLLGIRVLASNRKNLGLRRAFRRNLELLKTGTIFDMYPFLPTALYRQFVKLRINRRATYDRRYGVHVQLDRRFAAQVWSGLCLALTVTWLPIPAGLSGNQFSANSEPTMSLAEMALASMTFTDMWPGQSVPAESSYLLSNATIAETSERSALVKQPDTEDRAALVWVNPFSGFSTSLDARWRTQYSEPENLITWVDSGRQVVLRCWRLNVTDKSIQNLVDSEIELLVAAATNPGDVELATAERQLNDDVYCVLTSTIKFNETGKRAIDRMGQLQRSTLQA